jgi:hypothetical protein
MCMTATSTPCTTVSSDATWRRRLDVRSGAKEAGAAVALFMTWTPGGAQHAWRGWQARCSCVSSTVRGHLESGHPGLQRTDRVDFTNDDLAGTRVWGGGGSSWVGSGGRVEMPEGLSLMDGGPRLSIHSDSGRQACAGRIMTTAGPRLLCRPDCDNGGRARRCPAMPPQGGSGGGGAQAARPAHLGAGLLEGPGDPLADISVPRDKHCVREKQGEAGGSPNVSAPHLLPFSACPTTQSSTPTHSS